jgi:invasion protein IalB
MRILSAIVVLALLAALDANAAGSPAHSGAFVQTGDVVPAQGQGWTKLCFNVPVSGEGEKEKAIQQRAIEEAVEACFTYAEVRDAPTQILTAIYGVLQMQSAAGSFLIAFLPLYGVPGDPGYIQLDDAERIQLGFIRHDGCDGSGCYAMAPMPPALLDWMKGAKAISANSAGIDVSGRKGSVSLPCCGFGAALDGAPVAPEAQDEMQREVQKILRRHWADFIR